MSQRSAGGEPAGRAACATSHRALRQWRLTVRSCTRLSEIPALAQFLLQRAWQHAGRLLSHKQPGRAPAKGRCQRCVCVIRLTSPSGSTTMFDHACTLRTLAPRRTHLETVHRRWRAVHRGFRRAVNSNACDKQRQHDGASRIQPSLAALSPLTSWACNKHLKSSLVLRVTSCFYRSLRLARAAACTSRTNHFSGVVCRGAARGRTPTRACAYQQHKASPTNPRPACALGRPSHAPTQDSSAAHVLVDPARSSPRHSPALRPAATRVIARSSASAADGAPSHALDRAIGPELSPARHYSLLFPRLQGCARWSPSLWITSDLWQI